ncbi:MAG: ABC transporter ATP-binding protein [Geminicoccaceae bacterium]|nr:ABC transporter ATP-binding protein [Geminicoccaceae bacterium]
MTIRDVTRRFAGEGQAVLALDGVSLDIDEGAFFTLLGPSGCGKTTLLRIIAGFERPDRGAVRLDGADLVDLPPWRRPVNTVFQSYALFPHMSVLGNVAFGLEMQGVAAALRGERAREALRLVRLEDLAGRRPAQLSGGQQQRVALARALAVRPKVLLLDEPLSALDLKLRKEMQLELKRLKAATGITFVFVTHDQEEALTMSDRIAVMEGGHVLQVGSPREIYEEPAHRFVAGFIGETNFLEGEVAGEGVVRLKGGGRIAAAGLPASGSVTLAVRPERVALVAAEGAQLRGRVLQVVYIGTDSTVMLDTGTDEPFTVRVQNREGGWQPPSPGSTVGVAVPADAARVVAG